MVSRAGAALVRIGMRWVQSIIEAARPVVVEDQGKTCAHRADGSFDKPIYHE